MLIEIKKNLFTIKYISFHMGNTTDKRGICKDNTIAV